MKRIVSFVLTLFSVLAFVYSCQQAPALTLSGPRSYTFTRDGGSQSFTFNCNRDWSINTTESWISASPSSGTVSDGEMTVTIKCAPNTAYDPRTATLTVRVEDLAETITINQDTGIGLIASPTTLDLTNAEQVIEIDVQKNVQYTVAIDDASAAWIKQGGTKALTTDKITFTIAANTSYDSREGKIVFKQLDGNLTETVTIRQNQTNGLFITTPDYNLSNEAHTLSVEVKANVEFEVTSQADWITYVETKALKPSTIVLSIPANEGYDNRTGTVLVKQTNGDLSGIITINQKQTDYLAVTPTEFVLSNQAQTVEIEVQDNITYSVVIPDDAKGWISVFSNTQTKALTDDKVTLSIVQNTTYDDREASVTIKQTDGNLAETVIIRQSQTNGLFITIPTYNLSNEAHTLSVEVKANVEFEVTSQADWITHIETKALKASTIALSITANENNDNRTGTVLVKQTNGDLSGIITINQKQTDYLAVTPTSFEVSNQEQTIEFTVSQNVAYSIVIPDTAKTWVAVQNNVQTKAIVDDKVVLVIAKNTTYDDRETSVTIKQNDGSLAETVSIKQAYGEGLIPDQTTFEINRYGGSLDIGVQANVDYEVTTEANWVHYVETKALSASTFVLTIDENPGYTEREAVVAIKQKSGDLVANVTVKQTQFGAVEFEGYNYKTIKYGEREWFAENLRAKFGFDVGEKLNENGDRSWPNEGSPWAEVDGELLYSMEEICFSLLKKGISVCPEGWHISTADDWNKLFSMSSSASSAPFVKKTFGGTDDFSFGGNYGNWHTTSFWLEKWLFTLFEDNAVISNSEGAFVESHSANQRHFPAENYRHIRCVRGPVAPIIQTLPVIKQTTTSAELRFEVLNNPGAKLFPYENDKQNSAITKVEFKYGTNQNNLSSSLKLSGDKWTGSIEGLTPGTVYYYQPVVEYEGGDNPVYGEIMSFKTYYGTLEYQGDTYFTTLLGNVEIMSENLRSAVLNDGTTIPLLTSSSDWLEADGPGQCVAFNKDEYLQPLGRLYNGYVIQTEKICPVGWRLPKNSEILSENFGNVYGNYMETGSIFLADNAYWGNPVLSSNDSALSILPSGQRYGDTWSYNYYENGFVEEGFKAYIWTNNNEPNSLDALECFLQLGIHGLVSPYQIHSDTRLHTGFSVRCVREKNVQ